VKPTFRFRVRGMVQGVGFRFWTQREARRLGLIGFVRNAADGSVEVLAGGPRDQLELLHEALRRGPSGARVDAVEILTDQDVELPNDFEIRR
jgi:acylphosphatase